MGVTTNVPDITINQNGVEVPETYAVLTGVLKDFNEAFGGNLNIKNVGTPQGLLSAKIAHNIARKNAAIAYLISMFSPSSARGRFLDALAEIYFIQRRQATATVVTCQCTGVNGFTLPAGSLAQDDNGYIYESLADATFGTSGTVDVQFACQTLGAIDCAAGTLTTIKTIIPGWDAITNLTAGVIGENEESDREFEARRYDSVSKNAQGSIAALQGSIASLEGVTDVCVRENNTSEPIKLGVTNYSLLPHSVYVAVVGGTDEAVANQLFLSKNAGSNMNGNTSVKVQDTASYNYPYPEYTMTFNRPTSVPIYVVVNIDYNDNLPAEIVDNVKSAVIAVFSGQVGSGRARIGGTVYSANFYESIAALSDYMNILSVYIGKSKTTTDTSVTMGIDEAPVISTDQITVNLVGAPV